MKSIPFHSGSFPELNFYIHFGNKEVITIVEIVIVCGSLILTHTMYKLIDDLLRHRFPLNFLLRLVGYRIWKYLIIEETLL